MKRFILFIIILLLFFSISCGKDTISETSDVSATPVKKYLARNVIYNEASANSNPRFFKTLYASTPNATTTAETNANDNSVIDTTTKVLASNIIFEKPTSTLVAITDQTNVQAVLEEIQLDLSKVIIGDWTIKNRNYSSYYYSSTGQVSFYPDGRFNLSSGSFTAIGISVGIGKACDSRAEGQTYEFLAEETILFSYITIPTGANANYTYTEVPRVIKFKQDEIIIQANGGACGSQSSVSILTRIK